MEMIKVESSNVERIGWEDNNLFVEYKGGNLYKYENVTREIYLELLGSKSRGHYLNESIKGKYTYTKIK